MPTDHELTRAAERIEAEAVASMTLAAPAPLAARLGLHLLGEGGAVMALASAVDVLQFNRVVALGVDAPAAEAQLDRLLDAARARGVRRLFVHEAPGAAPAELTTWLAARGAAPYNRWVRHWRRPLPLPDAPTALGVAPADRASADAFGGVVAAAFGMPPLFAPWLAALVGRPGWAAFVARDGEAAVAAAAMYAHGDVAWLGLGATLASHRGRGGQSALLAARLAEAARLGCAWCVIETAEETPEHPVPSYRNVRRAGFASPYARQNWLVSLGG